MKKLTDTPDDFKLCYEQSEIDLRVRGLGAEISGWVSDDLQDEELIVVPILRGAIFFFADLVREIDYSIQIAPVRSWGYRPKDNQAREEIRIDLQDLDVKGKNLLLVDDICDSGRTLAAIHQHCTDNGAKSVKSAVLIRRTIENKIFEPDYIGFEYAESEWFVGYGMNHESNFRNLKEIYTVKAEQG